MMSSVSNTTRVGMAETLGALVLGFAIDENAVIGVDIIPSYADMSSGIFRYASADRLPSSPRECSSSQSTTAVRAVFTAARRTAAMSTSKPA